jgi:FtsH-binding integral membrane protein
MAASAFRAKAGNQRYRPFRFRPTADWGKLSGSPHWASPWNLSFVFWIIVLAALYLVPTFIAYRRQHINRVPILVINIFFGWSFIGWVAWLAWSLTNRR